jgi:FHA domain-containing protein
LRSLCERTAVFPSRRYAVIPVVIAVVVAVLLLAVVVTAIVLLMQWRSEQRSSAHHFPLIVPTYSDNTWQPEPFETEVPVTRAPLVADVAAPTVGTRVARVAPPGNGTHAANGHADEPASAETIRFNRPAEEVLQLLPGRLEVLAGETRHREIRFVRAPGQPPQLILGRDAAGSAQHVALQSSTVSRQHARLAYSNGTWAVSNLSQTNPVVVNDEELSGADRERPLVDGDRIELGEVVLRFHAH